MSSIIFPNNCSVKNVFDFCSEVSSKKNEDSLTIDFSRMGRIEPFTMLYVAKHIRDFNRRTETKVRCKGHKDKDYAANMAFFRAFGLKHGREPGSVDGNDRFVPFTIIRVRTIVDEANKGRTIAQEVVEEKSSQLAAILSQNESKNLQKALTFSIREMMRNVVEHSDSKRIEYCAQYWPSYKKVEISITDSGIGLKSSLSQNPYIKAENHAEAIQQALMPGISGKNYKGALIDTDDPWHNSGFGLYMISRICRAGGNFLVCSGDHAILLDESGKEHIELGHRCRGTAVRMVLNTKNLAELPKMLTKFNKEGEKIAKKLKGVGSYTSSAASRMLSEDFEY